MNIVRELIAEIILKNILFLDVEKGKIKMSKTNGFFEKKRLKKMSSMLQLFNII